MSTVRRPLRVLLLSLYSNLRLRLMRDLRSMDLWLMRWWYLQPLMRLLILWHLGHELHLCLRNWAWYSMTRHSASCIWTISNNGRSPALSRCETICSMILDHVILQVLSCTVFRTTMFTGLPFPPGVKLLVCSEHTPVVESLVAVVTVEPCREPRPRQGWSATAASYPCPSRVCVAVRRVGRVPRVPSRKLGEIVPRVFFFHECYLVLLQTSSFLFQLRGVWEYGTNKTLGKIDVVNTCSY